MAGKKNSRSSKTDHVLNLLSHPSPEPAPTPAPAAAESAPSQVSGPEPVRAEPAQAAPLQAEVRPAVAEAPQERRLSAPILEVARANNEALEETVHNALEDALQAELAQEVPPREEAPRLSPPEDGTPEVPVSEQPAPGAAAPEPPSPQESAAPEAASDAAEAIPAPSKTPSQMEPPVQEAEEPEASSPPSAPLSQEEPLDGAAEAPAEQGETEPQEVPEPPEEPSPEPQAEPEPARKAPPRPALLLDEDAPPPEPLPDGSRFTNVMLLLVEEKLERYINMFHLCSCPRCVADTKALALSRLEPKYVVLPDHAYAPMMNLYRAKYDSTVTAQIIYACKQVMDAPRHTQET